MPKKEYSLLSTEPLTEFDNFMLQVLNEMTEHGVKPRAAMFAVLDENGNIGTFYHDANLSDMILMRGFIDLDIQTDYLAANSMELPEDEEDPEEGDENQCCLPSAGAEKTHAGTIPSTPGKRSSRN